MSGIERANGHRPDGVLDIVHPALTGAARPDPARLAYDLDRVLGAIFRLRAEIPSGAFTATILGTEREGNGVLIGEDGVLRGRGLVNTREHLESLLESWRTGVATLQDYMFGTEAVEGADGVARYDPAAPEPFPRREETG